MERKVKAISISNGGICLDSSNSFWCYNLTIGENSAMSFGLKIQVDSITKLENGAFNVKGSYVLSDIKSAIDVDILTVNAVFYDI